jgi:holo-[acyl-carrier protein] synthase
MIIGIGTDIIEVSRIHRLIDGYGDRFLDRIFTHAEISHCEQRSSPAASFAARWAAKEAFFKALGTGMRTPHSWHDIIILNDSLGKPMISLAGKSAHQLKNAACHVSLSHTEDYATAVVIIEN